MRRNIEKWQVPQIEKMELAVALKDRLPALKEVNFKI